MSGSSKYTPRTRLGRVVHTMEETAIAVLLGVMTMLTFVNVVLRYVFNSSLIWGLELVLILFAWFVILGVSYSFKMTANIGVDAVTNMLPARGRRIAALVSALICVAYGVLMLKGAWDFWAPFAALQPTDGRWFPMGFTEGVRDRAFYQTDTVPMIGMFRWLEDLINYGDAYDKLPRVIPYFILPFGCALLLYRICEATLNVIRGRQDSLIVSHEAEDAVEEAAATLKAKEA
jgi:C4-dicarboxylate transporter DctQ subunit